MPALQRREAQPELAPDRDWWRGAVIYQIYPRSYQDSNGDGIGDLKGVIARLPYIASLGVDAIWISPFFKSPMKDFGYDVSDYRDVDPMFGTLADFDALVAEAHRLGLRVMIDEVISHTVRQHPWFQESRSSRDQPQGRLVRLGRRQARRHAAQQLAVDLRRLGLAVGHAPPAILPAQFPRRAARPQLPQQRSPGRAARRHPLLARARRRRLPARHDQLLLPQPGAGGQSAAAARGAQRPDRAGGEPLQLPGPHLRQEPAGEPRFPRALPRAARRISGGGRGRRGRRFAARARSRRRLHGRRRTACRCATPSTSWRRRRSAPPRCARCSRPSAAPPATAGPAGPSPTTT